MDIHITRVFKDHSLLFPGFYPHSHLISFKIVPDNLL